MSWVYMIKNKGGKLYVGLTNNPQARLDYHNSKSGASFTKNNPSFSIAFLEEYKNMSEGRKREVYIKKWRREKKDFLIAQYKKGMETKLSNS